MIVMKFGGTSLANAERIKRVAQIIKERLDKKPIVVVSAISGITDLLIEAARKAKQVRKTGEKFPSNLIEEIKNKHLCILDQLNLPNSLLNDEFQEIKSLLQGIYYTMELTPRTTDFVASFGEIMSSKIVAEYLSKNKIKAKAYNAWDIGLITDSTFGKAEPIHDIVEKELATRIKRIAQLPVITGFIAKEIKGEITTLGRNGGDFTAAIIGAYLNPEEIQIWTDVDGVMTADPKIIPSAKTIKNLSFDEACELAFFGIKVIHPKTIQFAIQRNIPVRILNSYNPSGEGTLILEKIEKDEDGTIKGIACEKNVTLFNVKSAKMLETHGFLAKIFEIFNKHKISVDVISTSEVSVSFSVNNSNLVSDKIDEVIKELEQIAAEVQIEKDAAVICMVGKGIKDRLDVQAAAFDVLRENQIYTKMISQALSGINITIILNRKDADKAIKALHKKFIV